MGTVGIRRWVWRLLCGAVRFVADLHVHSKFSRATSRECDLENLALWGALKGIAVVGTGDFTHPAWFQELSDKLVPAEPGLYRLRPELEAAVLARLPPSCRRVVRFMLSVEISTIYKRADKTRKVHHLLYMPNLAAVEVCNRRLASIGNIRSDGRPILGLDSRHLLEVTLESDSAAYLVPAHIWTPWFAALGSQSGFDAIEDCYLDLAEHVFAVETGLSSDPEMNWRVSSLDRYRLVSNSDAHSPSAMGREATLFETDIDYFSIRRALETGEGYAGTIEFFPEEGKYHLDGHRKCGVRWEPSETRDHDSVCTACGKKVTVGVLHRVDALADRAEAVPPVRSDLSSHISMIQLPNLLSEIHGVGPKSKRVTRTLSQLTERLGPELSIMRDIPIDQIKAFGSELLAEAIDRSRRGDVHREAGYDGEYGTIRVFEPGELDDRRKNALFDLPTPNVEPSAAGRASSDPPAPLEADEERSLDRRWLIESENDDLARASAVSASGAVLVVAGPGSGKTRLIAERLVDLVVGREVDPKRCLAITFTRRARDELRERLESRIVGERPHVETFHGFGLRILRVEHAAAGLPRDFRVATELERAKAMQAIERTGVETVSAALARLARLKRRSVSGDAAQADESIAQLDKYRAELLACDLIDLDDLLKRPLALLRHDAGVSERWAGTYDQIAIDELQDVDADQYELVTSVDGGKGGIFAVGDPDQAIYGFRGGDVAHFEAFARDHPEATMVTLDGNHRSSPVIVGASASMIQPSTLVPDRSLHSVVVDPSAARSVVVFEALDERDEASFVAAEIERLIGGTSLHALDTGAASGTQANLSFADVAVLYRTNAQAAVIAEALGRSGFPAQRRSHARLLDHPGVAEIADFIASHRCGSHGEVYECLTRCFSQSSDAAFRDPGEPTPGRSIASRTDIREAIELIGGLGLGAGSDRMVLLDELALGAEIDTWDPRADRISLLTLHASKGLQFDVVFIVGLDDGTLPLTWGAQDLDEAEERRLLFVGMSRARSNLYLSFPRRRGSGGPRFPSRFLSDVDPALLERRRSTVQSSSLKQLRLL